MAGGWWSGVGKALETLGALAGSRGESEEPPASAARGLAGTIEARLAGVLVSALHEAFARDAARLETEREQAELERRRAEAALRLELARQEAERQYTHLRAIVALDIVVYVSSLVAFVVHPFGGLVAKVLLALAWAALTAGLGACFVAFGRVSRAASSARLAGEPVDPPARPRALELASWLAVSGLGLAAASVIASAL